MKILPKNALARRLLKHPIGRGFGLSGYMNWPYDNFTKRRLKDGSALDWFEGARFTGSGSLRVNATVVNP